MPDASITISLQTQRHLGRHLATLYDSLPPPPVGRHLAALLRRLGAADLGTVADPRR